MKTIENGQLAIKKGNTLCEGVFLSDSREAVEITAWCKDAKVCKLCLYDGKKLMYKVPMFSMEEKGAADLFGVRLEGKGIDETLGKYEYTFEADRRMINDPYMKATAGRDQFGHKGNRLRGRFYFDQFDWSGENRRRISYEDMILYQCHLRGYTRHSSSGVANPGTYDGFCEKLEYIKELGVNTLLFLPIYDFNEIMDTVEKKVNYWGYTADACYFAPKASYAADSRAAVNELKQMIKQIHQNGMNVFFDMHFVDKPPEFMIRCLRYYVAEYHVDGFLVNPDVVSKQWIDADPVLRQCYFLGSSWQGVMRVGGQRRFAQFNDQFLNASRRFLKSDEGQVGAFFHSFKEDDAQMGIIHYITQKNGFTLRDLVSYDVKHNEGNGEKNTDGTEYNYSWNCGQEGTSRKKAVKNMRLRQMKNALCMLFLGQASPMLLAGDEAGRTQRGNNNAYCQDNALTWMDWNLLEKNKEIYEFTKMLIRFRKEKPLYHCKEMLGGMDTRGVGAPGVSGHGVEPWEADFSYYSRGIGILFYGAYYGGKSLYIAFNFHWDAHEFYLPVVNSTKKWNVVLDTDLSSADAGKQTGLQKYMLSPRSVVVFEGVESEKDF